MILVKNVKNNQSESQRTTLDSSASECAVNHLSYISLVEGMSPINIELADRSAVKATRRNTIEVDVGDRVPISCKAYLIPRLKLDILSCSRLD